MPNPFCIGTDDGQHARPVGAQPPIVIARREIDYNLPSRLPENPEGPTFNAAMGILLPSAKSAATFVIPRMETRKNMYKEHHKHYYWTLDATGRLKRSKLESQGLLTTITRYGICK
jgi:hypothetical protein